MALTKEQQDELDAQKQQKLNRDLRGLTYFRRLDEVFSWAEADADIMQKSNTPLLNRPVIPDQLQKGSGSNLMLMHDYKGGYLDNAYEACHGSLINKIEYTVEQWQRVEVFNYFTHNRVSIPPASWVNTGHRNGALVLGTFCVDDNPDGYADVGRILDGSGDDYKLADILARMAVCYGFDGWLLNFECSGVSPSRWEQGEGLVKFITKLREGLGKLPSKGKLIWYDSLTVNNYVDWQNQLNNENGKFAEAAGNIITNYSYYQNALTENVNNAPTYHILSSNLYSGVDCWGQNFEKPRPTFGIESIGAAGTPSSGPGYGGTATGLAINHISTFKLACGVFGLGWTYEHFGDCGLAQEVDRFVWEGKPDFKTLPGLQCECPDCLKQHFREDFASNPIANSAKQYPAGSETFFHSNYTDAFYKLSTGQLRSQLGQQSILPTPAMRSTKLSAVGPNNVEGNIEMSFGQPDPGAAVNIRIFTEANGTTKSQIQGEIMLHNLFPRADMDFDLNITYQKQSAYDGLKIQFIARIGDSKMGLDLDGDSTGQTTKTLTLRNPQSQIVSIGISVEGPISSLGNLPSDGIIKLFDIFGITLKPSGRRYLTTEIIRDTVKFEKHGSDETAHQRLVWSIPISSSPPSLLPFSTLTGPFSHFTVHVEGVELGRSYSLAFIIDNTTYQQWTKPQLSVAITGFSFDGSIVGSFQGYVTRT